VYIALHTVVVKIITVKTTRHFLRSSGPVSANFQRTIHSVSFVASLNFPSARGAGYKSRTSEWNWLLLLTMSPIVPYLSPITANGTNLAVFTYIAGTSVQKCT